MIHNKSYGSYGTIDNTQSSHIRTQSHNPAPSASGYQTSSSLHKNAPSKSFKKSASSSHVDTDLASRMGTLSSNYYDRAKLRRDDSSVWKAVQDMIQWMMGFIEKRGVTGGVQTPTYEEPEIYLEPNVKSQLEKFKALVTQRYDASSVQHELRLMDLWRTCMGDANLDDRVSELWKDLGFQGKDPQTDFRAAGIWALQNMLYFSENYPKKFKRMFKKTRQEKNAYPFAIAAINVTMLLLQILGVHKRSDGSAVNLQARKAFIDMLFEPDLPFRTVEDDIRELHDGDLSGGVDWSAHAKKQPQKELVLLAFDEEEETNGNTVDFIDFGEGEPVNGKTTKKSSPKNSSKKSSSSGSTRRKRLYKTYNCIFEEMFVTTFVALDSAWWRSSASYFNFPEVLKVTCKKVEHLLDREFTDIRDLRAHNKKVCSGSSKRHSGGAERR